MKVSQVALAAATMLGGSAILASSPVAAQAQQTQAQPAQAGQAAQAQQPQRVLNLTPAERTALAPLETAVRAQDWTAAQAALPAAQAAAQGPDARYFVGRAMWRIADGTQNRQLELQALDNLLSLANTPANERPIFLNRQAELAFAANDFARAERAFQQLLALTPNDTRVQNNLAIVRRRMGNSAGALEALLQTINQQEAAGQRVQEATYASAIDTAYRARQREQTLDLLRRLVSAYPTPANWRRAVTTYRDLSNGDAALHLDAMRMLRAAGGLNGNADYLLLAATLDQSGLPGETKAVVEEGVAAGALQRGSADISRLLSVAERRIAEDRAGLPGQIAQARSAANGRSARIVADALYGYGRYAEAAELYRLALSKGGEDANLVNTRLGATLALAGQRAEAEAALQAVTGPRADLAKLWLAWLARRPG